MGLLLFGLSAVSWMERNSLTDYKERLEEYERIFGFHPDIFVCDPSDGAKILFSNR